MRWNCWPKASLRRRSANRCTAGLYPTRLPKKCDWHAIRVNTFFTPVFSRNFFGCSGWAPRSLLRGDLALPGLAWRVETRSAGIVVLGVLWFEPGCSTLAQSFPTGCDSRVYRHRRVIHGSARSQPSRYRETPQRLCDQGYGDTRETNITGAAKGTRASIAPASSGADDRRPFPAGRSPDHGRASLVRHAIVNGSGGMIAPPPISAPART